MPSSARRHAGARCNASDAEGSAPGVDGAGRAGEVDGLANAVHAPIQRVPGPEGGSEEHPAAKLLSPPEASDPPPAPTRRTTSQSGEHCPGLGGPAPRAWPTWCISRCADATVGVRSGVRVNQARGPQQRHDGRGRPGSRGRVDAAMVVRAVQACHTGSGGDNDAASELRREPLARPECEHGTGQRALATAPTGAQAAQPGPRLREQLVPNGTEVEVARVPSRFLRTPAAVRVTGRLGRPLAASGGPAAGSAAGGAPGK
jgi:hypothetical protein